MASGIFTQRQVQRETIKGSWVNLKTPAVEYLVVAGGGSGGGGAAYSGGGGGAGGLLQGILPITIGTILTANVGGGGTGSVVHGTNGGDSAFGLIRSTGGGGGTYGYTESGYNGGSGGGGGSTYTPTVANISSNGIAGQGNGGGSNQFGGSGAGGGAGAAGGSSTNANGCPGGIGIASAISGTVTTYAGGGASGAVYASGSYSSAGGEGGGGRGAYYDGTTATVATSGTTNTGGGGGGACNGTGCTTAGNGGSGIVIVSYPDVYANAVSQTNATYSTSGSGSVAFSGTGQYLSTPSNSGFAFGTGDFTFETWFYANSRSSEPGFFQISPTAGGLQTSYTDLTIIIGLAPYALSCIVGGTDVTSGTTYISLNTWYHLAVTRSSGSVRVFVNGVLAGGPTTVTTNLTGTYAAIGGYYNSSYLFNGNISNLRVVKGTALYTSNFTPSTVPLTEISGTSLLMNTVSGAQFVDTSSNSLILTGTGTPVWNQLSPFATGLGYKKRVYTWTSSGSITF